MDNQAIVVVLGVVNTGAVAAMGYILSDLRSRIVRLEDSVIRGRASWVCAERQDAD